MTKINPNQQSEVDNTKSLICSLVKSCKQNRINHSKTDATLRLIRSLYNE